MRAMVLNALRPPLVPSEREERLPGPGEIRVMVGACGVCRTDLHVVDGDLPNRCCRSSRAMRSSDASAGSGSAWTDRQPYGVRVGQRVGIPWLGHTCGVCPYCRSQHENHCDRPLFTGFTRDGGFATSVIADARYQTSAKLHVSSWTVRFSPALNASCQLTVRQSWPVFR